VNPPLSDRPPFLSGIAEAGFGLLEAMVAIALLAGTMVAIFTLVAGILDSAHRVGRSNQEVQLTLNAIETMMAVNPMLQEIGKLDVGPYTIEWTSTAIAPPLDLAGSLYHIALYDCDVRVVDPAGSELVQFKLRRVGYRRIRDPGPTLGDGGRASTGAPMQ
jgi:type II secretory pathway pseudopilin PulG